MLHNGDWCWMQPVVEARIDFILFLRDRVIFVRVKRPAGARYGRTRIGTGVLKKKTLSYLAGHPGKDGGSHIDI